jgi:hypothetical protein
MAWMWAACSIERSARTQGGRHAQVEMIAQPWRMKPRAGQGLQDDAHWSSRAEHGHVDLGQAQVLVVSASVTLTNPRRGSWLALEEQGHLLLEELVHPV